MDDSIALTQLYRQARAMLDDFNKKIAPQPGSLVVLGLSTSEVAGGHIGKASVPEAGDLIVRAVLEALDAWGCALAVQCCEHLNRALVVERAVAAARGLTAVSVLPQPTAGGSAAAAAYQRMDDPLVVEGMCADAGIDIGVTMIGMHIRAVAVPVRTDSKLGAARVDFCYSRPKLIGGERARYR